MKAKKRDLRGGYITIALFALAATLLLFSTVGSSRAALTYFSETYAAQVEMYEIGVSLLENGYPVSWRDYTGQNDVWTTETGYLLGSMLDQTNGKLLLDHTYNEPLSVQNSGRQSGIDEYVRVSIYRYWVDANGKKLTNLDPSLIDLHILCEQTGYSNGWVMDEKASTDERTVLYYRPVLRLGEESRQFADTLTIRQSDGMLGGMRATVTTTTTKDPVTGQTIYTTTYTYDGLKFVLRADVDAVQTHNAADAIRSAWGIDMNEFGIVPDPNG